MYQRGTSHPPSHYFYILLHGVDFPGGSDGKVSAYNVGDPGSIAGLAGYPGEGNGNPLQYSCLENPMDAGFWEATAHGVAKSPMRLSDFTFTFFFLNFTEIHYCLHSIYSYQEHS